MRTGLEAALGGGGRLFLVSGEAGIGKTRLLEEVASAAVAGGAIVVWGRCWEGADAPSFWPWIQVLRALGLREEASRVAAEDPHAAAQVSRIVPSMLEAMSGERSPSGEPQSWTSVGPSLERFELLDGVTAFVHAMARRRPLVVLLDDLHAASDPSLLLLQFLARDLRAVPLLVVGAYRETEGEAGRVLSGRLGELARDSTAIPLRGLDDVSTRELIAAVAGSEASASIVAAVHQATAGNPFLVGEVVRLLVAEARLDDDRIRPGQPVGIPDRVRSTVRARLARLSSEARATLEAAAVIGPEFDPELLAAVAGGSTEETLTALSVAADVVQPQAVRGFRFVHALIRETIYDDLPVSTRTQLHARIVTALEARCATHGNSVVSALAYHALRAQPETDARRAVAYARRAGERALGLLAYEDATVYFEEALALLDRIDAPESDERAELLLAVARATMRAGNTVRAQEAVREAAAAARRSSSSLLLAEAALTLGVADGTIPDPERIALLEEALVSLDPQDSSLRARVLARLAWELYYGPQSARRGGLSEEAVAVARRLRDPAALAHALAMRSLVLWGQDADEARLPVATELLALAHRASDGELAIEAHQWRLIELLALGDIAAVDREILAATRLAERLRQPYYLWKCALWRSMRATVMGRLAEGQRVATEALALGRQMQPVNAMTSFASQSMSCSWLEGSVEQVVPTAEANSLAYQSELPELRAGLAFVLAEAGRLDDARRELETLAAQDFDLPLPRNGRATFLAALAETCTALGCARHAARLYELMRPYSGRVVVVGPAVSCFGPADRFLGLLATVCEDWEAAEDHFAAALTLSRRLASPPLVAKTLQNWATMLIARGRPDDRARAEGFQAEALETAERLGMRHVAEEARRSRAQSETTSGAIASWGGGNGNTLAREGEYWTFDYSGTVCRLRDRTGMGYLARLLEQPHEGLPALVLAAALAEPERRHDAASARIELRVGPLGELGEVLDERARAEYRARIAELDVEVEEAERRHDLGRAERLRQEKETLQEALGAALGLRGRARRMGSPAERARVNVTRALQGAIERVQALDGRLGAHLLRSVRTGTYCSYAPPKPTAWTVLRAGNH